MPARCCSRCVALGLDCSDEAQALRRRQLQDLMAKLNSGVTSVSDRGRSVSYANYTALFPLLRQLRREIAACELGYWPREQRLSYIDYVKGL
jgi:hypothetical protein